MPEGECRGELEEKREEKGEKESNRGAAKEGFARKSRNKAGILECNQLCVEGDRSTNPLCARGIDVLYVCETFQCGYRSGIIPSCTSQKA